ncbi:MAG TPA: hypothetical protein VNH80_14760, partial [Burkholderiales bacterium]|nr:hypothetical protein [Burkholderiales bacterium]
MQSTAGFWRDGVKRWRVPQWIAFLVSAGAALGYAWLLTHDFSYRIALDYAGDLGLPNWRLYRDAADIRAFAAHLGAGAHAYGVVLALGSGLASLVLAAFFSLAWLAWRRAPAWASVLGAAALLYAVTDWTALAMLRECAGAAESAPYALAAFTVTAKSWLFILLCVLAAAVLALALGSRCAWWTALFMDLPYLIDRGWRRLEFRLNQEFVNEPGPAFRARRFWQVPPFWLFVLTLLFTAYGPTPRGICSIEPDTVTNGLAVLAVGLGVMLVYVFFTMSAPRVYRHVYRAALDELPGVDLGERRYISCVILTGAVASFFVIALWAARMLYVSARGGDLCEAVPVSGASLARLALCAAALVIYAVAWAREARTAPLLRLQAILIAAVAVITGLLGGADATEASGRPYLHLFLALAPATCVVLWLALAVAERSFRRDLAPFRGRFRARLRDTELFVAPPRPETPSVERVVHGFLFQFARRFFELTMLPGMVAVIAPRQWLLEMTAVAFLMALAVSTWGNM